MKSMMVNTCKFFKNNAHIILSFLVPAVILIAAYRLIGIYPYGHKTILISDLEGQYIDFYTAFYNILKSKNSFFYSWQAGMGHNFLGLYAYYLASPFSFLILFFDKQDMTGALYLMALLKIGAAGLTFSIYLKQLYRKLDIYAIVFFSVMYALMSYCIVYSFNIMWLDGVILLPIVLLGVESIIRYNKFILFTVSIAITFIANFYISYMVGVFSFMYLLCCFFSKYIFNKKLFIEKLRIFMLSALLAAGSACFLMVPAFFALKNSLDTQKLSILNLGINFIPQDLLSKLPAGAYDTVTTGLPNIYCGLLALLAASLFPLNAKIRFREKAACIILLLFLILSFTISILNLMWHASDPPNWFPYRYSFLFSFLLLNMAAKCFNAFEGLKLKNIFIITCIWIVTFILISIFYPGILTYDLLLINAFFLSIYAAFLFMLVKFKSRKRTIILILLPVMLLESFISTFCLLSGLDREFKYASMEGYSKPLGTLSNLTGWIENRDNGFYRIERTSGTGRSFNDSMNVGYKGVTHFNSMANVRLNNFLNRLGLMTPVAQAVDYTGATLVTDSLLGVKYIITNRVRGFGYKEIYKDGDIKVYENIFALPVGFIVDKSLLSLKIDNKNPFELQNEILNLAAGDRGNSYIHYFSHLKAEILKYDNVTMKITGGVQEFRKTDTGKEAFIEIAIQNPANQQVYGYLPSNGYSIVDIYVNGSFLESYLHYNNRAVFDAGYHYKNEEIILKLVLKQDSFTITDKYFYGLDGHSFPETYEKLKYGALEVLEAGDTMIKGSLEAKGDGLLFTAIPYDKGWSAFIDGYKADIKEIGGAFIGVEVPEGRHEVVFRFVPYGLIAGVVTSILSLSVLGALIYLHYVRKN